jgi:hypothetical protein
VGGGDTLKKDSLSVARPDSPTFDSPIKKSISLVINEDELAGVAAAMKKEKKRSAPSSNSVPVQDEYDMAILIKRKEKEREREKEEKKLMKLKDVTNLPRKRQALKLMSDNEGEICFLRCCGLPCLKLFFSLPVSENHPPPAPAAAAHHAHTHTHTHALNPPHTHPALQIPPRTFLAVSSPPPRQLIPAQPAYLPTPEPSSPLTAQEPMPIVAEVPAPVQDGMAVVGGRERTRREKKSVNYAEPKLNTKMRRPDPPPGTVNASTRKRNSASAAFKSSDRDEADWIWIWIRRSRWMLTSRRMPGRVLRASILVRLPLSALDCKLQLRVGEEKRMLMVKR